MKFKGNGFFNCLVKTKTSATDQPEIQMDQQSNQLLQNNIHVPAIIQKGA